MGTIGNMFKDRLQDRIGGLLRTSQWSDCVFKIESMKIPAHRLILAAASPVFEVMMFGPMAEAKDILISDINLQTFNKMLNYIYTDTINITNIEEACNLLYAAIKYMLVNLQVVCRQYISSDISITNAILVFDFVESIQDKKLLELTLNLICKHTLTVFAENQIHISPSSLNEILRQDDINASELELLQICLLWADKECEMRNLNSTIQNKRTVLIENGIIPKIRLLTLGFNDYLKCEEDLYILLDAEIVALKDYLLYKRTSNILNPIVDYNLKPRKPKKILWRNCSSLYSKAAEPLWVTDYVDYSKITICCNQTVLVNSFSISSQLPPVPNINIKHSISKTYNENLSVRVIDAMDNVLAKALFKDNVEYNIVITITLDAPVIFHANENYIIMFEWDMSNNVFAVNHYPQQKVSDIGLPQNVLFTIKDKNESVLNCISYTF